MNFYSFLFLFFSFFFSFAPYAFLNIEALRQSNVEDGISGSSRFGLSQQKGNVDKIVMRASTLNQYKLRRHSFLLMAAYQYGESFSEIDNRNGHLHFRYTLLLLGETELEAFQQSEFNKFQNLKSRYLAGGGLRHGLFRTETLSLYLGGGIFYEAEKLENQRDQENPRGNLYLSFLKNVKEDYSISSTFYYQPNIDLIDDNRMRFNVGLETTFGKNFTQSVVFSIRRDTRPPPGIKKTDSSIRAGLGYKY